MCVDYDCLAKVAFLFEYFYLDSHNINLPTYSFLLFFLFFCCFYYTVSKYLKISNYILSVCTQTQWRMGQNVSYFFLFLLLFIKYF